MRKTSSRNGTAAKCGVERHYIEDEHPNALAQIPVSLRYLASLR